MRVLVVSEYHILNTGYATYYKNICMALHNAGHQVFELASYGNENLKEHRDAAESCPWLVYLNIPTMGTPAWKEYLEAKDAKFDAEFCSWNFENVVLDCMPDLVIAIRDHWYDKFILDSPLAHYYKVILSPTVDGAIQKNDWLDTFAKVDYLTTYNQWSEDWLRNQYGGKNIVPHIPPGPNPEYTPVDQKSARETLGLPLDKKILLTVMRNQGRKKYPELFEAISKLKDDSIILYCHTHFSDRGWDLPKLAIQNNIAHKVYFSYKCKKCSAIKGDIFQVDLKCKCGQTMEICSVQDGMNNSELNVVYNAADLYVQWHLSEGFGIPAIEAAAVGLPVITVNYSAQEDVAKKIVSFPVDPLLLQREMGTLCQRAIPNNDRLIEILEDPNSWKYNRETVVQKLKANYSWEETGKKWVELVNQVTPKNNWGESPDLVTPPNFEDIQSLPTYEFVRECILRVAQEPNLLGTYIHGEVIEHLETGFYIPEDKKTSLKKNKQRVVNKEMVYARFLKLLEEKIKWERKKNQVLNQQ